MSLGIRRRLALSGNYSQFVGMMKIALPALAAGLVGLIVVWPKLMTRNDLFETAFANLNLK
ncbi:MAG TPA: hypothetical protein HPQ04_14710, partial [Rhodospirillaceae bacterium]|nr:hypothetical protein [Rhodospirillaceae bacterium]